MNKLLALVCLLICATVLNAQDHILSGLYSDRQILELEEEHPAVIEYWETFFESGWFIFSLEENQVKKADEIEFKALTVPIDDFNPIDHLLFPSGETQYFRFSGTNKALIIYPKDYIVSLYNQTLKK